MQASKKLPVSFLIDFVGSQQGTPEIVITCSLRVLLDSLILLKTMGSIYGWEGFCTPLGCVPSVPISGPRGPDHCHLCPYDLLTGLLQFPIHGVVIQDHSEASVGAECVSMGSKWCWLFDIRNTSNTGVLVASVLLGEIQGAEYHL